MEGTLTTILPYLTGGAGGAVITLCVNWMRNRVQKMTCRYIRDEVLSKLPIVQDDGTTHDNIYCKHFELINTTNFDIEKFTIVFQFDKNSIILEYIDITKTGEGKHKMRRTNKKMNECKAFITNFIRGDKIKFAFKVANVSDGACVVIEDDCVRFKIKQKDCIKKYRDKQEKQATNILTILHKAEDE
jgi:hypothetical protein